MNSKQSISIIAIAVIDFIMIGATTIVGPDDASAKKSCAAKHYSHCKGDHHWYTKHGHHHCYKGERDCKYFEY